MTGRRLFAEKCDGGLDGLVAASTAMRPLSLVELWSAAPLAGVAVIATAVMSAN
jgi:hypothetical protein